MIAANVSNTDDWFKQASPAITKFNATELLKDLQSATTVSDQLAMWQRDLNNFDNASLEGINYPAFKKAFESWMAAAKIPDAIKSTLSADPKIKLPTYVTKYLSINSNDPASKAAYKEQLIKDFGGLKDSKGASVISPTLIDEIIDGNQDFSTLVDRVKSATTLAANKELGADAKQIVDITKTDVYKDLIDNPDKLTTSYNKNVAGLTQDATTGLWETGKSGVVTSDPTGASGTSGTYDYTGGIGQLSTDGKIDPAKMANMVNSYDTQKGVWSLPSINKDTGLFEANTSPYGQILTNSLNNYLSKGDYYSPTYVNSLASKQPAAMSSEGIAALKGKFTDLGTSKDLLNLANSAGMDYDTANAPGGITADSKLSPTLLKAYQLPTTANTTNTSSAGSQTTGQAKPGVPNLTGARSTAPVTALPSTTPGLITGPTIKTKEQADAEKAIADAKLKAEQEALAKKNAEALKLNQPWYKAGFISPEEYSAAIAAGFSTKADYNNYLKNAKTASSYADIQKANAYDVKAAPAQVNYIQAAGDNAAKYARSQDIAAIQNSWTTPGDAAKWIVANPNDPYAQLLKSQGYLDTPQIIDRSGVSTPKTTAPAQVNQGIAAGTSNFTNPDNMNVASGGIYNALPANTAGQVQQPATELPAEVVNQASTQANYYTANPGESQRVAAIQNSWTSPDSASQWAAANPNDPYAAVLRAQGV